MGETVAFAIGWIAGICLAEGKEVALAEHQVCVSLFDMQGKPNRNQMPWGCVPCPNRVSHEVCVEPTFKDYAIFNKEANRKSNRHFFVPTRYW